MRRCCVEQVGKEGIREPLNNNLTARRIGRGEGGHLSHLHPVSLKLLVPLLLCHPLLDARTEGYPALLKELDTDGSNR